MIGGVAESESLNLAVGGMGCQYVLGMLTWGRGVAADPPCNEGGGRLKAGLVDEVCPAPILLAVAKKAALGLADGTLRPSRPGIGLRERILRPIVFSMLATARAICARSVASSSSKCFTQRQPCEQMS